jgi:capsular exopolysaccharide synthesis family protein
MPNPVAPSALRDYVTVVQRRRAPILIVLIAVCGGMAALTFIQTPTYEATASVLLQPDLSESLGEGALTAGIVQDQSEVEVMRSRSVADLAEAELGHEPAVAFDTVPDTNVVEVTATSADPATAAADATGYARVYVESRRRTILDDLTEATVILQEQLGRTQSELTTAEEPLRSLEGEVAATGDDAERARLQRQLSALESQLSPDLFTLRARRTTLQEQVDQLNLTSQLTTTGGARLISEATAPTSAVEPQPVRNAVLALVAGTVLGLGLAFLIEQLDDRVHGRDEVEASTGGLAILGLIPYSRRRDRRSVASPTELQGDPVLAEAFRALRTSIQFVALGKPVRSIQVTSAGAADGKTTTVAGLAVTLAQAGHRVVVVDGDLRRPRVHELFGIDPAVGLTNALTGEATIGEAVHRVADQPGLSLVPCGTVPPNPSELLALKRFRDLITPLVDGADFVLIDTPPVLPVADARVVAGVVDATLLVVAAERSKVKEVQLATDLLHQVDAPLVGVVLNQVPARRRHKGYDYGYGGYVADDAAPRRRRRRGLRRGPRRAGGRGGEARQAERVESTAGSL